MNALDEQLSFDESSALDFTLELRKGWAGPVFASLRRQYDDSVASQPVPPSSGDAAIATLQSLPLYPWFSWLERQQQKMMWRQASESVLARADQLRAELAELPDQTVGSLELDPTIQVPDWYSRYDIHIQPGGVWSDDLGAFVYQLGAKIVMVRQNDDYLFHRLFVERAFPSALPTRVLDLGCGFGKSTLPLKRAYPDAEVIGIDLAASVLRLAHVEAERSAVPVVFRQADCRHTGLDADSFDVVTGTMLLHEMPPEAVQATLAESARLLRSGGEIRFLEFAPTGDPFFDATLDEHSGRNNEPFMPELFRIDLATLGEVTGFHDLRWLPFDERGGGLDADGWSDRPTWRFPWAVLAGRLP